LSACRSCGEDITWGKKKNNGNIALEWIGPAWVQVVGNTFQEAPTYRRHICDPAKMERWEEHENQQATIKRDFMEMAEREWKVALKRPCPLCHQPEDKKCVGLSKNRGREAGTYETTLPHAERIPEREALRLAEED
jgi:hypothetical protein